MSNINKKKFVTFGCSHTKWGQKPTWAEILQVYGADVLNLAVSGRGNEFSIAKLVEYLYSSTFDKNREIIFQLSYLNRTAEIWNSERSYLNYCSDIEYIMNKFELTQEDLISRYQHNQYVLYNILENNKINYRIMNITDEQHQRNLIPFWKDKIVNNSFLNYDKNSAKLVDLAGNLDLHMDPDSQHSIAKNIINNLGLYVSDEQEKKVIFFLNEIGEYIFSNYARDAEYKTNLKNVVSIKNKHGLNINDLKDYD